MALGLAGCSSSVQLPSLGGPPRRINLTTLAVRVSTLSEYACSLREMISLRRFSPQRRRTQREGELTQLNGKLYTVAKAQFDKQCPAVASGPAGSVVR